MPCLNAKITRLWEFKNYDIYDTMYIQIIELMMLICYD